MTDYFLIMYTLFAIAAIALWVAEMIVDRWMK